MRTYLIVTLTCPDRPGIVEQITEVLTSYSANWEESRMAHLGGDFAGIIKISVPKSRAEELANALRQMATVEMTVAVKVTQLKSSEPPPATNLFELRLVGADHEGIVHGISSYLAGQGVNVEIMETDVTLAPISGSPLFHMTARIKTPPGLTFDQLQSNLTHIGDEQGVDIEISPHQP